jgi:hypothetical protein
VVSYFLMRLPGFFLRGVIVMLVVGGSMGQMGMAWKLSVMTA